jgi:gas vesicle protein
MNELKAKINVFLIGMLSGVIIAAAFTYVFAIPANSYYWQTEICKRGGAAWTFDMKSAHMDWKWLVEPKTDAARQKRVTLPPSAVKGHSEQL